MGSKYLVFVDEALIQTGASIRAGDTAALGAPPSLNDRIAALRDIANELLDVAPARSVSVNSALTASWRPRGAPAPANVDILAGVGALVLDEEHLDPSSLIGVVGLTVVPDQDLSLPQPLAATSTPNERWHLDIIGPPKGTGKEILIGILDTGIDAAHGEFHGKTIHFREFDRAGRPVGAAPRDAGDHGTHVAGIAAGRTRGVAPDADLAVAAVLTGPGGSGGLVQIVNGFNWLIVTNFRVGKTGVDVVNASLGIPGFFPFLRPAIISARAQGVGMIAAIGNAGRSGHGWHGSPGNYPETLGIGATDENDVVADFSDWGNHPPPPGPQYTVPGLCAPGVNVHSAVPGGGYRRMSGTSMATPVVTGVAACRMESTPALRGNPTALFAQLLAGLAPYAPNPAGNTGGAGRIRR